MAMLGYANVMFILRLHFSEIRGARKLWYKLADEDILKKKGSGISVIQMEQKSSC